MKGILKFLTGVTLGAALGWATGFLRLPTIEKNDSFWVGFIASLALVLFILGFLIVWNKNSLLIRQVGGTSAPSGPGSPTRTYVIIWILVSIFIVLGGGASSLMIYRQNEFQEAQTRDLRQRIQEQSELLESARKANLVLLMGSVLDRVNEDLESRPDHSLSEATIARIAALSYSLKPYHYWTGDSLSARPLSPERGQLLLALSVMGIDSGSFAAIRQNTSFAGADLAGANLAGVNLNGADLHAANLKEAELTGALLHGANLEKAVLWGAQLDSVDLREANLRRADLQWAEINGADLRLATLDGADLSNAQLRGSDLREASLIWAKATGTMFLEANLACLDLLGTDLKMANLSNANLTEANLMAVHLDDARMTGANLTDAACGKDLLDQMTTWRIAEAAEFQADYEVVDAPYEKYPTAIYRLERVEK